MNKDAKISSQKGLDLLYRCACNYHEPSFKKGNIKIIGVMYNVSSIKVKLI